LSLEHGANSNLVVLQDLSTAGPKNTPLIYPEIGYRTELGGSPLSLEETQTPTLEEVEKHSLFYREKFCDVSGERMCLLCQIAVLVANSKLFTQPTQITLAETQLRP